MSRRLSWPRENMGSKGVADASSSSSNLGPLSPPPPDLATRRLPLSKTTRSWQRIHRCDRAAIFFNPAGNTRFCAPNGEYGVMYIGADLNCCFIETFGRLDQGATDFRVIDQESLEARCVSHITVIRPLRLVDLTGAGLRRIGADGRLCTGDHLQARLWAHALWDHSERPDGILYPARHDLSRKSVALFDRAGSAINVGTPRRMIDLPRRQLRAVLDRYGFALVEP